VVGIADGPLRINLLKDQITFEMASFIAAARGQGFKSGSLSFRAAGIVAGNRIAYFRCSSMIPPAETGNQLYFRKSKPAIETEVVAIHS